MKALISMVTVKVKQKKIFKIFEGVVPDGGLIKFDDYGRIKED